jgi:hypothetical protein
VRRFSWVWIKANPAPLPSAAGALEPYAPSNPNIKSFAVLVLTPLTVGTALAVLDANAGRAPLVSQGVEVLAPSTPKATREALSALPERFTVMLAEFRGEAAMAYQTSMSK